MERREEGKIRREEERKSEREGGENKRGIPHSPKWQEKFLKVAIHLLRPEVGYPVLKTRVMLTGDRAEPLIKPFRMQMHPSLQSCKLQLANSK